MTGGSGVALPTSAPASSTASSTMSARTSAAASPRASVVVSPGGKCLLRTDNRPNVRRGQLVMSSNPFVYVVKANCVSDRCAFCLKRWDRLQRCSGCQLVYFCNRECQTNAWSEFHRMECRRLKAVQPRVPPDTALLLARLIVKLHHGGDRVSERVSETRQRSFKDLMSHYKDIKESPQRMEHVASLCVVLKAFLGEDGFPNLSELIGMYGRVCVNSFNILDGEMMPVAVGVYLAPSVIDHSCQPNATAIFSGRTICIRATEDIPAFTWDKVRISYIDCLGDTETRQRELRDGYFFDCECPRCSGGEFAELERALRCGTPDCPARVLLPANPTDEAPRCQRCRYQGFPADVHAEFNQIQQLSRSLVQDTTVYYDACMRCLERQEPLLHPLNVYRVKTLDMTLEAAVGLDMWSRCLTLGQQLEDGYRLYYGPYHPLSGVFYLKLGKIALYRFQHELAAHYLRLAADTLRVSHGSDHELYRDTLTSLLHQLEAETTGR